MKINFTKIFLTTFLAIGLCLPVFSNNYIVVAKDGNVFDEANAKYITLNQNNDNVNVIPGMVFETSEHTPGWYKVEYSPGLHAFIPEQITASNFKVLKPGTYNINNNPNQKISVQGSDNNWTATVDGKTYKGLESENILIFVDNNNKIAFSLVDIGSGPIAINYDNSVTNFF